MALVTAIYMILVVCSMNESLAGNSKFRFYDHKFVYSIIRLHARGHDLFIIYLFIYFVNKTAKHSLSVQQWKRVGKGQSEMEEINCP